MDHRRRGCRRRRYRRHHYYCQTSAQARRIVADIGAAADAVGFTIAEFFPRQVMHLQQILDGFPLISGTSGKASMRP
jgi:hypothetical protein